MKYLKLLNQGGQENLLELRGEVEAAAGSLSQRLISCCVV